MSQTPWLRFGGGVLHLEDLPPLLERSQLLVPLFRRLLLESCLRDVVVSPEEQLAFQKRFLKKQGIDSPESLSAWLLSQNLTELQASQNILESLKLERFKLDQFGPKVEQVFLETKDQRDRVVYSLLRVRDQSAANELYLRISDGDATFTELSSQYSEGPERDTGGLIGPVELGRLNVQMAELLRISSVGQLWQPLELDGWWAIIRLDKRLPSKLDSSMERQIRDECFDQWLKQNLDSLLTAYHSAQVIDSNSTSLLQSVSEEQSVD